MNTPMMQAMTRETRRMNHPIFAIVAAAGIALSTLSGCASSDSATSPSGSSRAQQISRDASEQIAALQADEARRLREALALGEQGDKAFASARSLAADGKTEDAYEQYAIAVAYYSQAVSTYDQFHALWNNLGTALMAVDRFLQAEEAFIRATTLKPDDPRPHYNRGLLWRERGYPFEAKTHFERAIEHDPNYIDALWGSIRADITRREESRQTLDRIRTALLITTNPQHRQYLELERERIRSKLGLTEQTERRPSSTDSGS